MRPIYLLALPVSVMLTGWVILEYGRTVEMVELGARMAVVGTDLAFGFGCFAMGLYTGRVSSSKG